MTDKPKRPNGRLAVYYDSILADISTVIDAARRSAARSVNCVMTAAYWLIGRRIVEFEQKGEKRAGYGEDLLGRLSVDLVKRYGRGFSRQDLQQMRQFYLLYLPEQIYQTPSGESAGTLNTTICETPSGILQTPSAGLSLGDIARRFPLPWSAYVRLLGVKNGHARSFYETEALRGGWSVRQLDRQIDSQFYERTALSRNKAAMLSKGEKVLPEDHVIPEEEIKDPFVLEFLGLRDEYTQIFTRGGTAANNLIIWNSLLGSLPSRMTLDEFLQFLAAGSESDQQVILDLVNQRISETQAQAQPPVQKRIRILTMHGAKGLSGKVVFIPGAEQGMMPSFKALQATGLLIEQRRLFYVSVTRAIAHAES